MKNRYFLIGLITLFGFGGTILAASSKGQKGALSFDAIAKLVPGKTSKSELVKLLGKPDEVVDFKKVPNAKSTGREWAYRQKGQTRAAFIFEEGADSITSWTWVLGEGDAEQDLKVAQGKFSNAKWDVATSEWVNPHAAPMECFYKDEVQGVSIRFNLVRRKVSSITRWNPERAIASDTKKEPPTYCLDGACSPAIPAKEFFKEISVAKYCEEVH